jgi:hypothetical protein
MGEILIEKLLALSHRVRRSGEVVVAKKLDRGYYC